MIKPEEVAEYAKRKENENIRFRTYLKIHANEKTLDRQFLELHKEIFSGYDCGKCRNCCKMYFGSIPREDVDKDAEGLKLTRDQFIEFFLIHNETTGDYETKHMPCDFLKEDGTCMLGENRPDNCRDYPYTDRPHRLESLYSVLEAVEVCPAAYEIWERLKKIYRFRTGGNR